MIVETEAEAKEGMAKTISALEVTFQRIRTGRANPSLLDSIEVDYYGNPTPLKQVCNIAVENAKTLSISPWEKDMVIPCLLYTSPSPRDLVISRMPSSA